MRTFRSSKVSLGIGVWVVLAGGGLLATSCGGDPDAPPVEKAAVIDTASVTSAIGMADGFIGICSGGVAGGLQAERRLQVVAALRSGMRLAARTATPGTQRRLALGSTAPPDQLGDCGGRMGYRNYTHTSGVTAATLSFEGYCQLDSDTGERQVVDGAIRFTNTGTPTADGPVTTRLVADTTTPVTVQVRTAAGATVGSQTLSFSGFDMRVGVPGGTPTAANPDRMSMTEMSSRDGETGKTYRQANLVVEQYETASGNTVATLNGKGYRSDGSSYQMATTQPIVQDPYGDTVSGVVTFTGANSSIAVATLVPGATLQATLTVNGVPVTSVPACRP